MIPGDGLLAGDAEAHMRLLRLPDVKGGRCTVLGRESAFHVHLLRAAGATEVTVVAPGETPPAGQTLVLAIGTFDGERDPLGAIAKLAESLSPFGTAVIGLVLRTTASHLQTHPHLLGQGDLRRAFPRHVLRMWPCGAPEEVGRHVIHLSVRRPTVVFLDAHPNAGKSSLAKLLATAGGGVRMFSLDLFLDRLSREELPNSRHLTAALRALQPRFVGLTYELTAELGEAGLLDDLTELAITHEMGGAELVIWDGALPEAHRAACRAAFIRRGWVIWNATPEGPIAPPSMEWWDPMHRALEA